MLDAMDMNKVPQTSSKWNHREREKERETHTEREQSNAYMLLIYPTTLKKELH